MQGESFPDGRMFKIFLATDNPLNPSWPNFAKIWKEKLPIRDPFKNSFRKAPAKIIEILREVPPCLKR